MPPDIGTLRYAVEFLDWAIRIEEVNDIVILNPHNLNADSLEDIDIEFLSDKHLYRRTVQFYEDRQKVQASLGI